VLIESLLCLRGWHLSGPKPLKSRGLYLWTASINSDDSRKPLSLGTSALCMHVLSKWGRYRGRPELVDGVTATFKELLSGFRDSSSHYLEIRGQKLALWDQLHFNEGKVHYLWNFFAPVSLVTLMGLAERSELMGDPDLLKFMVRFSLWISDHVCPAGGGTVGVSGGESLADPKVWSTAQSVIVLSRILDRRHLFMMKPQGEASDNAIISGFSTPLLASDRSPELGKPLATETVGVVAHSVDVFISYAVEDKEQALHLAEVFGSRNIPYFLSEKNIKPGDNWVDEVKRALRSCKILYSLVTPSSLGSEWVQIEWNVASFLEKKIVPVLLRVSVSDLPERLRSYQSIDFHRINELSESEMLQRQ
jgi:TIR domain-containing protein